MPNRPSQYFTIGRRKLVTNGAATGLGLALQSVWWTAGGAQAAEPTAASGDAPGVFLGVFREGENPVEIIESAAREWQRTPAALMWFTRFGTPFPTERVKAVHANGQLAQITWEPWYSQDQGVNLQALLRGEYDTYILQYAQDAATADVPLMLRWGHEFNGDWYPWTVSKNGRDPALFARAWRHVVLLFRRAGAHKVQHVWCYNNDSVPGEPWNDPFKAYPGDDVVDWIGIDGYNFGNSQSWSKWKSFDECFGAAYAAARRHAPSKPIVIGEMASSEGGGSKTQWLREMLVTLRRMPAVRALTWFDIKKETDWLVASSAASSAAAIEVFKDPLWRSDGRALAAVAGAAGAVPATVKAEG